MIRFNKYDVNDNRQRLFNDYDDVNENINDNAIGNGNANAKGKRERRRERRQRRTQKLVLRGRCTQ